MDRQEVLDVQPRFVLAEDHPVSGCLAAEWVLWSPVVLEQAANWLGQFAAQCDDLVEVLSESDEDFDAAMEYLPLEEVQLGLVA